MKNHTNNNKSTAAKKPAAKKAAKKKAAKRNSAPRHPKVFGKFSVSSVLRAMGKRGGFTGEGAVKALRKVGKVSLEVTKVRSRLWRGKKGLGATPAKLSVNEFAQLKRAAA